jgi:hypothetical protein
MIFRSSQTDRIDYQIAYEALYKTPGLKMPTVQNAQLTQSFVRSIIPLSANTTQYNFQILINQNNTGQTIRPDEYRLNQQDALYVYRMNLLLAKPSSSTATNYVPYTWPNPTVFANTGLEQIYNGNYQIIVNNSVIIPSGRTRQFLNIPETQLTAATNSPQDQLDGSLMVPNQPGIVFVGLYQTTFVVNLPQAIGGTIDANSLLIAEFEGVLAQNVALGA